MMAWYCVNRNQQANGDHEVHNVSSDCRFLPAPTDRKDLGHHDSCESAVEEARNHYSEVNGCFYCSNECHTG